MKSRITYIVEPPNDNQDLGLKQSDGRLHVDVHAAAKEERITISVDELAKGNDTRGTAEVRPLFRL